MNKPLNVLMAQINPTVGAVSSNEAQIINIITGHQAQHDLIVFPELTLTGYPVEDLLFHNELHRQVSASLKNIQAATEHCYVLVGHPAKEHEQYYNCVSIFHEGQKIRTYRKQNLPNYEVFDEARYFTSGKKDPCILKIHNHSLGICICEDLWQPGPVDDLIESGITTLISLNASPFDVTKYHLREELLRSFTQRGISAIYVNQICGQDELLFDGQSFAMDKKGHICARAPAFEEALTSVCIDKDSVSGPLSPALSENALIYKALVCGTRDYVQKNQFSKVLVGSSGGIDSALTLAIAVDALGPEQVHAVMLPSRYTSQISHDYSMALISNLDIAHTTLSIEPMFEAALTTLTTTQPPVSCAMMEENLQARIRGTLLMALSNALGHMVLTTSNKSELAVGYSTLYGDMAGGFAVLKDVLKTQVYDLARYRNSLSAVIPEGILTRAPSAELRHDQTDQDALPEYAVLDAIITAYMEEHLSCAQIVQQGFEPEVVNQVIRQINLSEYKRRQSAPGVKISPTAFGKDWRYPITQRFKH